MDEYTTIRTLLDEMIAKQLIFIVEGKKDRIALQQLGVDNTILLDTHYKLIERVMNEKEVVVLVDLDKEGQKIYERLKRDLPQRGVKMNDKLWQFLFSTQLRHIEGLDTYMDRLKKDI